MGFIKPTYNWGAPSCRGCLMLEWDYWGISKHSWDSTRIHHGKWVFFTQEFADLREAQCHFLHPIRHDWESWDIMPLRTGYTFSIPNTDMYLVGGIPTPLKNMSSSVGIISPNIWKKNHVPNHQPAWNIMEWDISPTILIPSGNSTVCYWKWLFIVDLPIEHGDFP